MSLSSHFNKCTQNGMMPKTDGKRTPDGIKYYGPVLNGELSVEDRFALDTRVFMQQRPRTGTTDRNTDPVLRFHLRLDSDPRP